MRHSDSGQPSRFPTPLHAPMTAAPPGASMNSDVCNGPRGTKHGPSRRFSDGRRVQREGATCPRSPGEVDSAGTSLGPSTRPRFPRVPSSTSRGCADMSDVCLGAPRSPLPRGRCGWRSCNAPACQGSGQRVEASCCSQSSPPPPPRIRRAPRLRGPRGPSRPPNPSGGADQSAPLATGLRRKWKLAGSGRRDHPVGLFHPVTRAINDPLPKARMNKSPRCLGPASAGGQVFQVPAPRPCGKLWPAHERRKSGPRPSPGGACTHLLG